MSGRWYRAAGAEQSVRPRCLMGRSGGPLQVHRQESRVESPVGRVSAVVSSRTQLAGAGW